VLTTFPLVQCAFLGGGHALDSDAVGSSGGPTEGLSAIHGGCAHSEPGANIQSASHRECSGGAQGTYITTRSDF